MPQAVGPSDDPETGSRGLSTAEVEQQQDFRDNLAKIGCAPAYLPHDQFAAYIAADMKKWQKLIPALGIPQIE